MGFELFSSSNGSLMYKMICVGPGGKLLSFEAVQPARRHDSSALDF